MHREHKNKSVEKQPLAIFINAGNRREKLRASPGGSREYAQPVRLVVNASAVTQNRPMMVT
jgi:hypothetical protein